MGRSRATAPGTQPERDSTTSERRDWVSVLDRFRAEFEQRSASIDGMDVLVSFDPGLDAEVDAQLQAIRSAVALAGDVLAKPSVLRLHVSQLGLPMTSRLNDVFVGAYRLVGECAFSSRIDPARDYFPGLVEYAPLSPAELERALAEGTILRCNSGPVTHELGHVLFNESLLHAGGVLADYAVLKKRHDHIKMLERLAGHFDRVAEARPGDASAQEERVRALANYIQMNNAFERELAQPGHRRGLELVGAGLVPHNELFGDLVAALTTGDPDVIQASLRTRGYDAHTRNFRADPVDVGPDAHDYFGLVRADLGEDLTGVIETGSIEQMRHLVRAVFDGIVEDARDMLEGRSPECGQELTEIQAHNERLITKIRRHLAS